VTSQFKLPSLSAATFNLDGLPSYVNPENVGLLFKPVSLCSAVLLLACEYNGNLVNSGAKLAVSVKRKQSSLAFYE
jgi:hypothetical protein